MCENGACRSLRAMLKIYIKTLCSFLLNKFMPKSKYISDRTEAIFAVFVKERCRIILTRRFCLFQILHSDRKRFVFCIMTRTSARYVMLFEGRFHAMKICTDVYFHLCLVLYRYFFTGFLVSLLLGELIFVQISKEKEAKLQIGLVHA